MNLHFFKKYMVLLFSIIVILSLTSCQEKESENSSSTSLSLSDILPSSDDTGSTAVAPDAKTLKKLQDMEQSNSDTVAWLTIPGTTVDNAVMQTTDNEYYLTNDEKKQYNLYGCYYADWENTVGDRNSLSRNTVIYGHNMDDNRVNGLRFGQLLKFTDEEFARTHPYLYLTTEQDSMVFKIFAVYYSDIQFHYIATDPDDLTFLDLLNEAQERSEYHYQVDVNATDKILTLSTCTYKYGMRDDQRFVVQGRLVREGEDMPDTVSLEKNPDPKEPNFQ